MARLKLGVQISGRGSNLQALIEATADPDFPAEIALVVSNNPRAAGLQRARAADLPVRAIDHREYEDRESFEAELSAAHGEHGVGLICNAGFMRLLTDGFVEAWRDRLINIHPSLLPSFKGLNVHERVLDAGVRISGCTVHFVRAAMDEGPVIAQAAVPVLPADTVDELAGRVLAAEHRIYPLAVRLIAEGRVRVQGDRVHISGWDTGGATPALLNPLPTT